MKMRNITSILLAGLLAASAVSFTEVIPCKNFTASADETTEDKNSTNGKCGDNVLWSFEDGILTISGEGEMFKDYSTESEIPWDSLRSKITSVVIEDGVESIAANSFSYCENLTSVTIADTVKDVGNYSFAYCKELDSVIIPENVTYIREFTFYNSNINSITINNPLCGLDLLSNTIPNSATIYGYTNSYAQLYADYFNRNFKALNTELMEYAIGECGENISWFFGSEGLLYISGSGTLDSDPYYDTIGNAGHQPSWKCCLELVKEVYVSKGITELERECFYGISNATKIRLPDTLEKIGNAAFDDCSSLTDITIPRSVKELEETAFIRCNNLESITFLNPNCIIHDQHSSDASLFPEKTVICGYEGSTAQEYAEKYDRTFIALDGEKTPLAPTLLGDANCDGKVSIADATAIFQSLGNPDKYGLSEQGAANADIADTGNGVTPEDAVAIQRIDAKLE